ncbi:head completion/stabilization protein [Sodalis sp.]|uniref:head completion/stabilization protein n=1 Tax=Sodalis sp. (in: enterobacteria) TaxID=1898979 RepID=UPI003873C833
MEIAIAPVNKTQEPPVANTAFWPAIDLEQYRAAMRQDGTLTPVRVREAALNAMHEVNARLAVWRQAQESAGYLALDAVPAERLDGESLHVQRYRCAVFCLMQASLTERFRSIEATGMGQRRAETLDSTVDDLRRDASWAINAIQGRPRMTIALI